MPRKNPITPREREIGQRFRGARIAAGYTQVEMAKRAGIDSNRLASYEHGRNPFPYRIAHKIARETGFNQRWLATGKLPQKPFFLIDSLVEDVAPANALFSHVFDAFLWVEFMGRFQNLAEVHDVAIEDLSVDLVDLPPLWSPAEQRVRSEAERLCVRLSKLAGLLHGYDAGLLSEALECLLRRFELKALKPVAEEELQQERSRTVKYLRGVWDRFLDSGKGGKKRRARRAQK